MRNDKLSVQSMDFAVSVIQLVKKAFFKGCEFALLFASEAGVPKKE